MKLFTTSLAGAVLGGMFSGAAMAGPYTFVTLNVPGARQTVARGINDSGTVVGNAGSFLSETSGGFVYSGGSYTAASVPAGTPNATGPVSANGINNAGDIVGSYRVSQNFTAALGYVLSGSTLTSIKAFSNDTIAYGINSSGVVTGRTQGASPGSITGFTYTSGVIGFIPQLLLGGGLYPTFVSYGLNDAGHLVGKYFPLGGGTSGFFFNGAAETQISYPGTNMTYAYGINNADDIVGYYSSGGHTHGFLDVGGVFSSIDVPGAFDTVIWDINNLGQIVGQYTDALGTHGFIGSLSVPEPTSALMLGLSVAGLLAAARRGARQA